MDDFFVKAIHILNTLFLPSDMIFEVVDERQEEYNAGNRGRPSSERADETEPLQRSSSQRRRSQSVAFEDQVLQDKPVTRTSQVR